MFLLGFIPVLIVCKILDSIGLLRVPAKVELEGVDFALHQLSRPQSAKLARPRKR